MTGKAMLRNLIIILLLSMSSYAYSAALISCIRTNPSVLNINQRYTVIMAVTNTGITDAPSTTPDMLYVQLPSVLVTAPVPADIPAGSYQEFTWVYQTNITTGTGIITGLARSAGDASTDACGGGNTITVYDNPALAQDIFITPSQVNVGQEITILMNVTNTGGSNAEGVAPGALIKIGTGSFYITAGPVPSNAVIAPAANQWFTWVYTISATGNLCVNGDAAGYAQYSKVTITSAPSSSNCITIQNPASLVCGLNAMPPQASVGQDITLVLSVTNNGQADAINVCPLTPGVIGPGGVSLISGPSCATITGGSAAFYTWLYSAVAPGVVMFTSRAQGTDANSEEEVMSGVCVSANVGIASLVITCMSIGSPVSVGQNLTVVMNVSNTGSNVANNVVPSLTVVGDASSLILASGPNPASAAIAAGGAQKFTWIYTCTGTGNVSFYEEASGTDPVFGLINAVPITCGPVVMQTASNLMCEIFVNPAIANIGQILTVTMVVTNTGGADAINVVPGPLAGFGTGAAIKIGGPIPPSQLIHGGSFAVFTWTYSAAGTGTFVYSGTATGTDVNSGFPVSSGQCVSSVVTIQTPASLICALSVMPTQASVGQNITLVLSVTNVGQADAVNVCALAPGVTGSGSVSLISAPVCAAIPGFTAAYFTWIYSAVAQGVETFTDRAQGTDANSGMTVSTGMCTSNTVLIQTFASLSCGISVYPAPVLIGGQITVVMSVTNSGQATANLVHPSVLGVSGTASCAMVSGPLPANMSMPGGSSGYFTWVFTPFTLGYLCFSGNAQGTDINSGMSIYSGECGACLTVIAATPTNTPTHTSTSSVSGTPTPTVTATQCVGEGSVVVNPAQVTAGSCDNTIVFTYTNGPTAWATPAGYGTLKIKIPAGWSAPSIGSFAPGYFTVSVTNGSVVGKVISGNDMVVFVDSLAANTGQITVTYGDKSGGGPGACAQAGAGPACFNVEMSPDSLNTCPLQVQSCVDVIAPTPTITITPTVQQNTPTLTATATQCIGEGDAVIDQAQVSAGSCGNTVVLTYTNGPTSWDNTPGYGTLKVVVPAGWSAPSMNPNDPGYFSVIISSGNLESMSVIGNEILIEVSSLPAYGGRYTCSIIVTYGDKSSGGPGACAQAGTGTACFDVEMDADGGQTCPLISQPCVDVVLSMPTDTPTVQPSVTSTPMPTNTAEAVPPPCFITKWGTWGNGDGEIAKPVGAAVDSSGNVYITEYGNDRVQEFSSSGAYITKWGNMGTGNSQFNDPDGIAVDSSGNVYVIDHQNHRLQKFSGTGAYITQWGGYGSGDGQFAFPVGVAVDSGGNVYVADMYNYRIQKFDSAGTYITQWGSMGNGNGNFNLPLGVAVDSAGNVYVTDSNNNRIQKFSNTGTYITQWGSLGSGAGQFNGPYGISTDSGGNVYIADSNNNRIQKFSSTGSYITQWGSIGNGDGRFSGDPGLAVDSDGNVYVTDWGNDRVQKFGACGTPTETPSYTYTPALPSATQTPTITPTLSSCVGDGDAVRTPVSVIAGSCGNYVQIIYMASSLAWASLPGYGTLKVTVPPGWTAPDAANPLSPGYVDVVVFNGTLDSVSVGGMDIFIQASEINPSTGGISVIYGSIFSGGPGACAQPVPGIACFNVEMDADGNSTCPIAAQPCLDVLGPTQTNTETIALTATFTNTPQASATPTITRTVITVPTPVPTEAGCVHRDASFGGDGIVTKYNTAGAGGSDVGKDITVDSNGKIIVAGSSLNTWTDMAIWRYNPDGSPDTSFNSTGYVLFDGGYTDYGNAVTLDSSGRIVVTGAGTGSYDDLGIWRYNSDGTPDTSFNGTGYIITGNMYTIERGFDVLVDAAGKILITGEYGGGNSDMMLYRYNDDGSPDTTFNGTGRVYHNGAAGGNNSDIGFALAIDGSGKIIVTGTSANVLGNGDMAVWRYNTNGTLDTTFNSVGYVTFNGASNLGDLGNDVVVDSNGKILVAGASVSGADYDLALWRYNPDGTPDTTFNGTGFLKVNGTAGGNGRDWGNSVAIDSDGRITVAGFSQGSTTSHDMVIWRFNPDGSPDTTFNGTGYVINNNAAGGGSGDEGTGLILYNDRIYVSGFSFRGVSDVSMAIWAYVDGCGTLTPTVTETEVPTQTITPSETNLPTQTVSPTPPSCCTPTMTPTITATPPQGTTLLSIKKSVSGQPPAVGAIITYELEISNKDTKDAFNPMVWDTLPAQVQLLYSAMPYTITGQYVVWDLSSASPVKSGDFLYIEFECKITGLVEGAPIGNYAGCDYNDASGKHAPIFSELAFYPLGIPAVYPNPATDHVRFTNIVPGSQIDIYTLSGEFVNSMEVPMNVQTTIVTWPCINRYNARVSAGIYYYLIKDSKGKARYAGKLFIMRP